MGTPTVWLKSARASPQMGRHNQERVKLQTAGRPDDICRVSGRKSTIHHLSRRPPRAGTRRGNPCTPADSTAHHARDPAAPKYDAAAERLGAAAREKRGRELLMPRHRAARTGAAGVPDKGATRGPRPFLGWIFGGGGPYSSRPLRNAARSAPNRRPRAVGVDWIFGGPARPLRLCPDATGGAVAAPVCPRSPSRASRRRELPECQHREEKTSEKDQN